MTTEPDQHIIDRSKALHHAATQMIVNISRVLGQMAGVHEAEALMALTYAAHRHTCILGAEAALPMLDAMREAVKPWATTDRREDLTAPPALQEAALAWMVAAADTLDAMREAPEGPTN